MKDGFKSATIIATLNLLSWKKDYRIWSVGTVIMVLIIRYLIGVPLYALPNGKTSTALLLPVLLADAMNSNGLLKVLIFFGGILLFCDAPFLKDNNIQNVAHLTLNRQERLDMHWMLINTIYLF